MKMVMLGVPGVSINDNRWKDDLAESAEMLGWDVVHLSAKAPTEDILRECKNGADMFLWSRSHNWNPQGDVDGMLRRIEDLGIPTVSQHMDLYWGIKHREPQIGVDPFWSCQYVFTADGGHQKEFAERGVNHYWCPPAMSKRWIGRGTVNHQKYPAPIVFVGGYYSPAHGRHRVELLRWARGKYFSKFRHYDGKRSRIWGPALNDLYTTAHVAIGDSAPSNYYWSDRVVHTLGRGGLLAHTSVRGMKDPENGFTSDVMIHYERGGFTSLGKKIAAITPERRLEMSDRAMALIEERHTWQNRLLDIQGTVLG